MLFAGITNVVTALSGYLVSSSPTVCQFGQLAACSMLHPLPVVVLFLILSRKLGGAFALGGAIKG